jgi:hypothetical protein
MEKLYKEGRIVQTSPRSVPAQKRYLDEMPGVPLQDLWLDIKPMQGQSNEMVGYSTQKPEPLLERIINLSSDETIWCWTPFAAAARRRQSREIETSLDCLRLGPICHSHDAQAAAVDFRRSSVYCSESWQNTSVNCGRAQNLRMAPGRMLIASALTQNLF